MCQRKRDRSLFGNFVTGSVLASAIELMFFCCRITDKGEQIHSSVFGKFSIHQYFVHSIVCAVILDFEEILRNRDAFFSHAYVSRIWISCLLGCKPKKKGVAIQNCSYCRFTGHKLYVLN